eukprot:CAMPEP_0181289544 /NCGR_PEP_ID=MMETSP1101-20121128/937_1 /TAXON_ID=46948 /ORGANISM="Rhodomonas abbreviata, Strain Caron Lab Isolate" /LENGTH=342 /DNA_ID=CAMNT_0023393769 /DNA_START=1 /DNA_END=1027 /DNA_ORIENTATION=-
METRLDFLPVDGRLLRWTDADVSTEPDFYRKIKKAIGMAKNVKSKLSNGKACRRCREKKYRCDSNFPCSRCTGEHCTSIAAVERPITQTTKSWLFVDGPSCDSAVLTGLLQRYEPLFVGPIAVVDTVEMANIFRACPPGLEHALARTAQSRQQEMPAIAHCLAPVGQESPAGPEIEAKPKDVCCNNFFSSFMGYHAEEVWAKIGQREIRRPTTQYRLLCLMLWQLFHSKEEKRSYFLFAKWGNDKGGSGYNLVRVTNIATKDQAGMPTKMLTTHVIVSPEAYDRARACSSSAHNEFMHCTRTAAELIAAGADVEAFEAEENIANMAQSAHGRMRLEYTANRW